MSADAGKSAQRWLLLHGTPLRPWVWSAVSSHLPGEVWAPDVTPAPPTAGPQRHLAERIIAQARVRDEPWNLVGHSVGGQIPLEIACAAPDVVDELIIICSRDTPFPRFRGSSGQPRCRQSHRPGLGLTPPVSSRGDCRPPDVHRGRRHRVAERGSTVVGDRATWCRRRRPHRAGGGHQRPGHRDRGGIRPGSAPRRRCVNSPTDCPSPSFAYFRTPPTCHRSSTRPASRH